MLTSPNPSSSLVSELVSEPRLAVFECCPANGCSTAPLSVVPPLDTFGNCFPLTLGTATTGQRNNLFTTYLQPIYNLLTPYKQPINTRDGHHRHHMPRVPRRFLLRRQLTRPSRFDTQRARVPAPFDVCEGEGNQKRRHDDRRHRVPRLQRGRDDAEHVFGHGR